MQKLRNILILSIVLCLDTAALLNSNVYGEAAVKRSGCTKNVIIPHGFVAFVEEDQVILYECFNGYAPYGEMKATCKDNKWDAEPPRCIKKGCNQLKIPIHGNPEEEFSGALVRFQCDSGYELLGESFLTCDGAKWSGNPPACNKLPRQVLKSVNKTDL